MKISILFLSITGHQVLSPKDSPLQSPHLDQLRHDISTDELYPADACLFFTKISHYVLTGDRLGQLKAGEIKTLSPRILVAGHDFGCGSAREHPVIALQESGVEAIFALSFNQTFRQNCLCLGVYASTNLGHLSKLIAGESVPLEEILEEFQGIEKEILMQRGLFNYNLVRLQGKVKVPKVKTSSRPMTMAEKIIAKHLKPLDDNKAWVRPGDQAFTSLDFRMTYEVFTPLIAQLLAAQVPNYPLKDPQSIILVADHFISSPDPQVKKLIKAQEKFAKEHKTILYTNKGDQAEGISHSLMIENHLLPGQLAVGTDSHSSMWGVLGALGIPIGATAMANAFLTKDTLITVPPSVKIKFQGKLAKGCSAKDLILKLAANLPLEEIRGRIIEFDIKGLDWPVDELSVLTCMAKEMGALTAIMVPNEKVIRYLIERRGLKRKQIEAMIVRSDRSAEYSAEFSVNLGEIEPMVALPGSPSNSIPISQLPERVKITKAYIGSCVGGKWEDLVRAAKVLKGKKVADGVQLIIQPASMKVLEMAREKGLVKIFQKAGSLFLPPSCGACIGQGPGRVEKGEVGISASTRNYPGRMGKGEVYLASPAVVAASAVAGHITDF